MAVVLLAPIRPQHARENEGNIFSHGALNLHSDDYGAGFPGSETRVWWWDSQRTWREGQSWSGKMNVILLGFVDSRESPLSHRI